MHVVGTTQSRDLALVMPLQLLPGGGSDVLLATLDMENGDVLFATYLGGSGDDVARALAAGPGKRLYLTGYTSSSDLPLAAPVQAHTSGTGDGFVMGINLDQDEDGIEDYLDNCPEHYNPDQMDRGENGTGDVCEPPRVSGVWPGEGLPGDFIFIFGEYFYNGSYPSVAFNETSTFLVQLVSDDMLIAILPPGDTSGLVTVHNDIGMGVAPAPFGNAVPGLQITGAWPGVGVAEGGFVFIFGSGFGLDTTVQIGTLPVPLVQVVTTDMLIFIMPSGAETAPITVSSGGAAEMTGTEYRVLP